MPLLKIPLEKYYVTTRGVGVLEPSARLRQHDRGARRTGRAQCHHETEEIMTKNKEIDAHYEKYSKVAKRKLLYRIRLSFSQSLNLLILTYNPRVL